MCYAQCAYTVESDRIPSRKDMPMKNECGVRTKYGKLQKYYNRWFKVKLRENNVPADEEPPGYTYCMASLSKMTASKAIHKLRCIISLGVLERLGGGGSLRVN